MQRAFVAALRQLIRTQFDGNQHTAADKLGFSQPYISQLLSMKRSPGIAVLLKISERTGVAIDELIGRPPSRPMMSAISAQEIEAHARLAAFERELSKVRQDIADLRQSPPPAPPSSPSTKRRRPRT